VYPQAREGWVDPELAAEFPDLCLWLVDIDARSGKSPEAVKERLRYISDRFRGAQAVAMRTKPIPHAYRVFFRHIGLDPDTHRTPIEAAAVERLLRGRFKSHNLLDDALTLALMETGVPVWALDRERVRGDLGVRPEAGGRLVVADSEGAVGVLFGDLEPGRGVTSETVAMTLFSLQVNGVPSIHVEEALWMVCDVLGADG
jgi:DNA/RNA-binding domain of Phe-tRNA-synthetase-like protein